MSLSRQYNVFAESRSQIIPPEAQRKQQLPDFADGWNVLHATPYLSLSALPCIRLPNRPILMLMKVGILENKLFMTKVENFSENVSFL
jgi:hypothetical protein